MTSRCNASMGPRLVSRGNSPIASASTHRRCTASMGPRLVSRGNRVTNGHLKVGNSSASMGPRLVSRGNVIRSDRTLIPKYSLQWGRGLLAAEMSPGTVAERRYVDMLQWGRGLLAAEISSIVSELLDGNTKIASMGPRLVSRGNSGIKAQGRVS